MFLNYFSCVAVVGFPWYIHFSKWLGRGKLHNDIDLPPLAILLDLLVINHSSCERRNIFVPRWLKLSRVLVVLQLAWMRLFPQLSWHCVWPLIRCQGTCDIVPNVPAVSSNKRQGLKWLACSIDTDFHYAIANAPELSLPPPSPLTFRLRKFLRGFPN